MSDLNGLIDQSSILQDTVLASALSNYSSNPLALTNYIKLNQQRLIDNIKSQKKSSYNMVSGNLEIGINDQKAIKGYHDRSDELMKIQDEVYQDILLKASNQVDDKNIASRKTEMNEWSVENKNETLFIFSSLFILLSVLILISILYKYGIISSSLWLSLAIPFIIIFIIIVLYRSKYTDTTRNQKYWNQKKFEGNYGPPVVSCPI